ncbi:MAG: ABC transporter substrate-binding protein, partial [Deltaproteobacteria bacterium]|nr:ABC transporter substrate-binding protein [Deltaproteobacteria bacterium]
SGGDPKNGLTQAERLITNDKVVSIMGAYQSSVTYPSTQVAEKYEIPYIVPSSYKPEITERGFKYTFRIAAKGSWFSRDQIRLIGDLAKEGGTTINTVGFVYENGDAGKNFAKNWKIEAEKAGLKVVLDEAYPDTLTDFSPVVLKMKSSKADAFLLCSNASDAILLSKTIAEMKCYAKVFVATATGHADPAFLKNLGKNAEYLFDLSEWEADSGKASVKEANEKFKKKTGHELSAEAVDSYVGMYVLANALEKAGSLDPKKIREALAATKITTGPAMIVPYEAFEFDQDGQNKFAGLVAVQIRDVKGTLERVTIWPKAAARSGWKPVVPFPKWEERK